MRISLALLAAFGLAGTAAYAHEAAVPRAPYMQPYLWLGSDLSSQKFQRAGIEPSAPHDLWSLAPGLVLTPKFTRSIRLVTPVSERWRFKEQTATDLGYGWQGAAGIGRMGSFKALFGIGISRQF